FGEYSEDLVAQIDAPRLAMTLDRFDCSEDVRFININLVVGRPSSRVLRPYCSFSTSLEWTNTQAARISAVCSDMEPTWNISSSMTLKTVQGLRDHIDHIGWPAFFRQLTTVKTLYIYGRLGQIVCALEDVPGEMVTEELPSLQLVLAGGPRLDRARKSKTR
ncbi:hypothetical protein EDB83DRAFT_2415957, partial [Lactarius deliciosus]